MGSTQREMPVIPSAEASSSTCVPVPENSCSGRAAAENSRSAPDGAERPTSSPACARDARDRAEAAAPPPVQEWRTGKRQPWVHHNAERKSLPYTLQIRCAPHKSARSDQFKTVTSTEMGPGKGAWATDEVERILDMQVRDDGTLWYLVEYCSAECDEGEEPSWQPAEYLAGCPDKIAAFFTDPEFRAPNCKYNHNKCVCRCRATISGWRAQLAG